MSGEEYHQSMPHQALEMKNSLEAFAASQGVALPVSTGPEPVFQVPGGDEWVPRKRSSPGVLAENLQTEPRRNCGQ